MGRQPPSSLGGPGEPVKCIEDSNRHSSVADLEAPQMSRWKAAESPSKSDLSKSPTLVITIAALFFLSAGNIHIASAAPIQPPNGFDSFPGLGAARPRVGGEKLISPPSPDSSQAADNGVNMGAASTIPVPGGPWGLTYDPVNARLFIGDFGNSSLSVLNTVSNQLIASIPLAYGINDPVYDASNGLVYVADTTDDVYEVNATNLSLAGTVVNPRGCGGGCAPDVQAYDPANQSVYLVDTFSDFVSAIQNSRVIAAIPIGPSPLGVGYDGWNDDLYVANYSGAVVVDGVTNRVTDLVRFTGPAFYLTEDTSNGNMFVDDENTTGQANVTVISGTSNTIIATIPVGFRGGEEAYDPLTGNVYVALDNSSDGYEYNGSVAVINGTSDQLTSVLPVQQQPEGLAYDSFNHEVYVANLATGSLSLLLPFHRIAFVESGLNPGTPWSVVVNNISLTSNDVSVSLNGANGPYQYSIPSIRNYTISSNEGGVSVAGENLTIDVRFVPVTFTASFQPQGLPATSNWSVTLGGVTRFEQDNIVSFQTANGTLNFTVSPPKGFQASPANGSIRVVGANLSVTIAFASIAGLGPPPSRLLGVAPAEGYLLVGAVGGLLVLVAAAVIWVRVRRVRPPPRISLK